MFFAVLFVGLIFLSKDVSNYSGNTGAILTNYVLAYIIVPIPALDTVLMNPVDYAGAAHHTFGFLVKALTWLGFSAQLPAVNDTYVYVPLPTNVYTVYKYLFIDFGWIGMLVAISLIAFLQTSIYRSSKLGSNFMLYLSALLVYPAIVSIFDDAYSGSGLVLIIKATCVGVLYFGLLNRLTLGTEMPSFRFLPRFYRRVQL